MFLCLQLYLRRHWRKADSNLSWHNAIGRFLELILPPHWNDHKDKHKKLRLFFSFPQCTVWCLFYQWTPLKKQYATALEQGTGNISFLSRLGLCLCACAYLFGFCMVQVCVYMVVLKLDLLDYNQSLRSGITEQKNARESAKIACHVETGRACNEPLV